ncbi:MAG: hypothetical protein LBV80_10740, partial [Deltaproteobacteria bacterium]|nr:hypothetical protein [Deltaproteobacteria bacterium]
MSTVRINRPEMGERQSVTLEADQSVAFAFNASVVSVDRVGNDLVVRFDNGAETSIQNFFVTDGKALPAFVLEDGTEIAGADLLRQLNDAMDIETAAGPSSSANDSGGAGEYDDGAGDLIDGVARLDALGTANWVGTTEAPESMLAASGEYGNSGNNTPVVPDGPGDYAPEDPVVPEEPGDDDPEYPVVPEEPGDDDPEDPVVPEEPGD